MCTKKLTTVIAVSWLSIATPVFACPGMGPLPSRMSPVLHRGPKKDSSGTNAKTDASKEQPKAADTAKPKAAPPPTTPTTPKDQPRKSRGTASTEE
jgi:hypothetical protein